MVSMNRPADQVQRDAHHFRVNGCLFLKNSIDPDLVQGMQTDFLARYAGIDRDEVEASCLKVGVGRYMFTVRLQKPYMNPEIYAAPGIIPVVKELLGDDCIIQSIGVVCAYPGAEMQHVHRDNPPLFPEAGGLNAFFPPYALHVVVPLVDLDEATGTTALWEGSHRVKSAREERKFSREALERLEGAYLPWPKIGDSYFMDFRLRHAGTANRSDQPRPILYLVYSRRWYQDRKNYEKQSRLLISRAEYEQIPAEHRHLFDNALPQDLDAFGAG